MSDIDHNRVHHPQVLGDSHASGCLKYEEHLHIADCVQPHSVYTGLHGEPQSHSQTGMGCSLQFVDRSDSFFDLLRAFAAAYNSLSAVDEFAPMQPDFGKVLLQMREFKGCLLTTLNYFIVTPALTLEDARIKRQVFRAYMGAFAEEDASTRLALSAFDDQDRLEGNPI